MKENTARMTIVLVFLFFLTGCGSLLPSAKKNVKCPYDDFGQAKEAFDKIVVGKTDTEDLKSLGFDPFTFPNIEILTYLDVIAKFMPNPSVKLQDLDFRIRDCVNAQDHCRAYEVSLERLHHQREGSVFLDMFNFRRKTKRQGWRFNAIIVLKDDLVVYKLCGGKPSIDEMEDKRNPLGPAQSAEDFLLDATLP